MTTSNSRPCVDWKTEYEHMKKHSRMWERRAKENLELAQKLEKQLNASEVERITLAARLKDQALLNELGERAAGEQAEESVHYRVEGSERLCAAPFTQLGHSTNVPGEMVYQLVPTEELLASRSNL